jgi:hypothetical protein
LSRCAGLLSGRRTAGNGQSREILQRQLFIVLPDEGAVGFLEKPFEASALLSMIHAALDDSTGVSSQAFMESTAR